MTDIDIVRALTTIAEGASPAVRDGLARQVAAALCADIAQLRRDMLLLRDDDARAFAKVCKEATEAHRIAAGACEDAERARAAARAAQAELDRLRLEKLQKMGPEASSYLGRALQAEEHARELGGTYF